MGGRADVNLDGLVNQADVVTVQQSAPFGTNVTCGVIQATSFSCGVSRSAPNNPAIAISIDEVSLRAEAGVLTNRRKRSDPAMIDVEFAHSLVSERMASGDLVSTEMLRELESTVEQRKSTLLQRAELTR